MRNVGIIGAGHVGESLASRLVETGHRVKVANSRGPDSLGAFAQRTGAEAVAIADIALDVDVLMIAIPMARIGDLPKTVIASLPKGAIVVDAGNYYPLRDGAIAEIDAGLIESQWVSRTLGVAVIKAFNNIIASLLASSGRPEGDPCRIALPVAGDDPKARAAIMAIVERLGFSAVDAGPLSESWRQQPGQPAYCTDPTCDELPLLLQRADRAKAPQGRDRASRILAKLPDDYPAEQLVRVSRMFVGLDRAKPGNWLAVLRLGLALLRAGR
ncbi:NADPH-dependent F420 reductase [Sphingomonas abietis]|uniref:NAD(P)-binding domain-containing protein n=1 Tax=Sphingomonas abietis TaxID=3012344 RepID=A0ABY7NJM2_9SPHN|nr:NAD(P)-binding domain-containing protein [Sphingomonas abietis]WBO21528.1 NAD(P)-binding domain-containing protein [Sphingomonas abietis]